jgi:hypothetical protein
MFSNLAILSTFALLQPALAKAIITKLKVRDREAYLFCCFKSWYSLQHLVTQQSRFLTAILFRKLFGERFQLIDIAGDAPPCALNTHMATFSVYPEVSVIKPLDQVISSTVAVGSPGLYGEWLIQVIVMSVLPVVLGYYAFNGVGR